MSANVKVAGVITLTGRPLEAEALSAFEKCSAIESRLVVRTPNASAASSSARTKDVTSLWSSESLSAVSDWFATTGASHLMLLLPGAPLVDDRGARRLVDCARAIGSAITYSDYWDVRVDGSLGAHPLIDYQDGSVRDDFDFGTVMLLRGSDFLAATREATVSGMKLSFGALYDARLRMASGGSVFRVAENLYRYPNPDTRASGQKNFDYCDPRARDYQIEMERVATEHLRRVGAWLPPPKAALVSTTEAFKTRASVVIPVRDRVKTVGDAVKSALAQQASFPFNVLVVDNHSTDGTTQLLAEIARADSRLKHVIPDRKDLLIGGCWNEAIYSNDCGEYAVQLDSDDIYSSNDVLERVMAEFQRVKAALVIGSYTIVNFNLETLPPGLIDHREWTDENGHNNALRIAGLGAPRAYHVPTLRAAGGFPNTSYGEDYGAVLRLTREYPVGRLYDSLYWCRRWEGNSDSALPLETSNRYSVFKDRLRTIEIAARRSLARERR